MASRRLEVEIIGDSRSLERAFGRSSRAGSGFSKALKGVGIAAVATGAAITAGFIVTLKRGFDELSAGQKVSAQTAAALKSTGEAAGVSQKHIEKYASELARIIPIDDEVIQAGQNVLLSFTSIRNELGKGNDVFDRATKVAADYASRTGKDMSQAALIFGKALESPVKMTGALSRAGVVLTQAQKDQIKAFEESGNRLAAQKVLLQALEDRYKGAGEAAGKTLAGQLEIAKNQFDEIASTLAVKFLPILTSALTWINANWPTISAVFAAVGTSIERTIKFLGPVFEGLIAAFRRLAEFAKRHWGEVQAVAADALAWYRGTLAPAIQNVLTAIRAFWDRFGKDITRIVQTSFGVVFAVVKMVLGNIASVIQIILALIRGDWGTAWSEMKEIPVRMLKALVAVIRGMASMYFTAMQALGRALIDGIVAGLAGLKDVLINSLKGAISGAISAVKGLFGISSPSKVTADEIGKPLGEGVIQGWLDGSQALPQKMNESLRSAIDQAAAGIAAKKDAFTAAFQELTSGALSAFDKLNEKLTKTEALLAKMDAAAAAKKIADDIAAAQRALADAQTQFAMVQPKEGEDPQEYANRLAAATAAIVAAQATLDEALAAQRRAALEKKAAAERKAQDEQTELDKRTFADRLERLQTSFLNQEISAGEFNKRLIRLFKKYEIPFNRATNKLGLAMATGLREAFTEVQNAARALAQEVLKAFEGIVIRLSVDLQRVDGKKAPGRAVGGPVQAGSPYIVGERGPEMFVPGTSGNIIPNSAIGSAAGGAVVVNVYGNLLTSKRDLEDMVRRALYDVNRRNPGALPA